jgi:hypothetical protein
MALYLVVHTPVDPDNTAVLPPTRMLDLARDAGSEGASPRWLRTWSPDLHDDRIFSLWEADDAAAIGATLDRYGYLSHMSAQPLRVQEWGPADVIAAEGGT